MTVKQNFQSVEDYIDLSSRIGLTSIAPTIDIRGKVIVITGAADGIGRALTEGMVHFGARKVIAIDNDEKKLATLRGELGDSVHTIVFDLREHDYTKYDALGAEIAQASGRVVDVAVLNAARSASEAPTAGKRVGNTSVDELNEFLQVNVAANWLLFHRIEPFLDRAECPIVLGSTSPAVGRAAPAAAAYSITKGAFEAFLQQLMSSPDVEDWTKWVRKPLCVMAVNPGRVGTKMRAVLYPGEPLYAQPLAVDVIEPYLRLVSHTVNLQYYGNIVVSFDNTVARKVKINGIKYKMSKRSENGFVSALSTREINAVGQTPWPLQRYYDSGSIRQLMDAGPVPEIDTDYSLARTYNVVANASGEQATKLPAPRQGTIPRIQIAGPQSVDEALMVAEAGAAPAILQLLEYYREDAPDPKTAKEMVQAVKSRYPGVETVMVTHSTDIDAVIARAREIGVSVIQLHNDTDIGKELTLTELRLVREALPGVGLIKVLHVPAGRVSFLKQQALIRRGRRFATVADALILDTKAVETIKGTSTMTLGGTGNTHNWHVSWAIVEALGREGVKILLAGGLTPENVGEAIEKIKPYGVDVNSGTRAQDGGAVRKDPARVQTFCNAAKQALGIPSQVISHLPKNPRFYL